MKLSVPANFDNELILKLKGYPVKELYGKLSSDFVGGGRSSYLLGDVSRKYVEEHIGLARRNNIGFNYLLNAACLNNQEITRSGQKKIRKTLDWISKIGASSVTVSNPLLLRMIKRNYPQLKVRVSVFAGVDHVLRAKYWENMGADVIALDSQTVNREFKILKALKKKIGCELELLVNGSCIQSCPYMPTHMNLQAHGSQTKHQNNGFVIDYCAIGCEKLKINDPVNFLRSDWIRPEDIYHYEKLGYEGFKLVERNLPTPVILARVKAYSERKYEGNLLDIFNYQGQDYKKDSFRLLKYFLKPFKANLFKLEPLTKMVEFQASKNQAAAPIRIDNQKLDGFIDRFLTTSCRDLDCRDCNYCSSWAEKVIDLDASFKDNYLECLNNIENLIESGELFYAASS